MDFTKPNNSPYVAFVQRLYEMELQDDIREKMQRTVTFNFSAEDACMLAAIAKRFGKSTASFGGELYADSVRQLFLSLSRDDRFAVASEADSEYVKFARSKGIEFSEGYDHWLGLASICDRIDSGEFEGSGNE